MKNSPKFGPISASIVAFVILLLATSFATEAQTKRKKKVRRTRPAATRTVPAPTTTGEPTIVSRADDYQDSSTQIIQPVQSVPVQQQPAVEEDPNTRRLKDIQSRIKKLEASQKNDNDEKQKRLASNIDILTKAEERVDSLRKQKFDLTDKENSIRARLEQIEVDIRPDMIERSTATTGSLRPEELREARRKSLDSERQHLQSQLDEVTAARAAIDQNLLRAEALAEKLRDKLEKEIDDSFDEDKPQN